jgi:hypothetical protein
MHSDLWEFESLFVYPQLLWEFEWCNPLRMLIPVDKLAVSWFLDVAIHCAMM